MRDEEVEAPSYTGALLWQSVITCYNYFIFYCHTFSKQVVVYGLSVCPQLYRE